MANLIDTINKKITNTMQKTYGSQTPEISTPQKTDPLATQDTPQVKSTVIKTEPVQTITSSNLAPVNKTILPPKIVDNSANKLSAITDSVAKSNVLSYEDELKNIRDRYNDTDTITNLMKQISDTEINVDREAEDLGAQKNLAEYKRLGTEIDLENENTRQAIEKIQRENPTGALRGGQIDLINNIERDSANRKAILTIQRSAALGDYQTAVDTAKAKVEMRLAPLKAELDRLKFVQDNNKEFKTAELNLLTKRKENEIKREEERLTKGEEMIINALAQGVSNSTSSKARDVLEKGGSIMQVANVLGKYAGDYLGNEIKRASLAKTNAEINKIRQEMSGSDIDTTSLPNTTNAFITKLMASVKNSKDLDASERQNLSKARTVISQLDSLQSNIAKQNGTGLLKGKVGNLMEKIGADADVGTINAQLQAIVPNLARGTYGEVGVLTDNDIANYRKTLPRIDRPQDQNDAVMALTLKTVLKSMENTLSSAANSNINVSGWTQDYLQIKNQINTIEDRIGVSKEAVNTLISQDPQLLEPIKEMYQQGLSDRDILEALNAD